VGPQALRGLRVRRLALAVALAALAPAAGAVERCEVNGESVSPNNGNTTAGKTGLMRCREDGTGPVVREQELQNGRFMGVVRRYKDGVLEREHRVNEKGNQDGLAREYAVADGRGTLVSEETYRNGTAVGLVRRWHPDGTPRRVAWNEDGGRDTASAEFTREGKLASLRCADRPRLAPAFDDAKACGFAGETVVSLFTDRGAVRERRTLRGGEAVLSELLFDGGAVRERAERSSGGGSRKVFAADGVLLRETQWAATPPATPDGRPGQVVVLEREFHEKGTLVKEKRWAPSGRGADLVLEQTWYLNKQPRERNDYETADGETRRRETTFFDSGAKASEGTWVARRGTRAERPTGVHRGYDEQGRLRAESTYDERGRIARERVLDESGRVVRDDEVFEDGSRKAVGR
jgi:antitoxin component YwqK of YwqJK toxin-antitoxin module